MANFQVSQYDMESMNGVLAKTSSLPLYKKYTSDSKKKDVFYKLWVRHTIPWNLACETSTLTQRENVFDLYSSSLTMSTALVLTVHITATILLAMTAMCLTASACTGYRALTYKNNRRYFLIQVITMGVLQLAAIIICFIYATSQKNTNIEQLLQLSSLQAANQCSDQFTQVPIAEYQASTQQGQETMTEIWPLALSLLCVIAANFAVIVLVCSICVPSGETDEDEEHDIEDVKKNEVLVPKRNKRKLKD
jgi:hypothetical protein